MSLFNEYLAYVNSLTKTGRFKNNKAIADHAGIAPSQVVKYQKEEELRNVRKFLDFLEKVGGRLAFPDPDLEAGKDVCFVNAQTVSASANTPPPMAEDYIAAPLVGEVGAGPGFLPEESIKSWFLAYKHMPAIRHRRNLIAVEIGNQSTSMQPTLNPGDIVLVDRDDRDVLQPGKIMLVRDPKDGSGMVKRVAVSEEDHDFRVAYYSDNVHWPPLVYSLRDDFAGEWDNAIIGHVIWAWKDMTNR